ncbi:hypothetical protein ACDZ28_13660 [Paenibacillus sp. RS8]|uniref:hypothetical protein n=1 Tax=Paenibacillus sp. RS8 TaxID=3242681 RepID=UPI0035C12D84
MPTFDELKFLTQRRLNAAELLNDSGFHDIAYQDSGYIIEFGLKAAICKSYETDQYPEEEKKFKTHHFDSLVYLAGLSEELSIKKARDRAFMKNWSLTTKWSVHLRYKPIGDQENTSNSFLKAVKSEDGGVLPWIKSHW